MSKIKKLHIDIVSDLACPWCYIGFKRLQKAITKLRDDYDISHRWLPYELFPTFPPNGVERKHHMASLFGSHAKAKSILSNIARVGREEGLELNFDRIAVSVNTYRLHRILWKAHESNTQDEVAIAFFEAFFVKGINLADEGNIITLMQDFGWSKAQTIDFLHGSEGEKFVNAEKKKSLQLGIRSVPYYILNSEHGISGAQTTTVFESCIREFAHSSTQEFESHIIIH